MRVTIGGTIIVPMSSVNSTLLPGPGNRAKP